MKDNILLALYKKQQTVFTLKEISLFTPHISYANLRRRIHYAVATQKLKRIRPGVYGKENYNILEAVNKIYTPSYISLETVLEKEGIIFQHYTTIFACSYLTRKISVGSHEVYYRMFQKNILLNNAGIIEENGYHRATKERAFLDAVFLYKNYHFDNLHSLNWEKISDIKKIYQSSIFEKRVEEYYDQQK